MWGWSSPNTRSRSVKSRGFEQRDRPPASPTDKYAYARSFRDAGVPSRPRSAITRIAPGAGAPTGSREGFRGAGCRSCHRRRTSCARSARSPSGGCATSGSSGRSKPSTRSPVAPTAPITRAPACKGHPVARRTVERLMRELGIEGVIRGGRRRTTVAEPRPRPRRGCRTRSTAGPGRPRLHRGRPARLRDAGPTHVRTWHPPHTGGPSADSAARDCPGRQPDARFGSSHVPPCSRHFPGLAATAPSVSGPGRPNSRAGRADDRANRGCTWRQSLPVHEEKLRSSSKDTNIHHGPLWRFCREHGRRGCLALSFRLP